MRVAHVKSLYGPIGGIETMLEGVFPALAAHPGVEPVLFFVSHQPAPDLMHRLTAGGRIECHRLAWHGLKGLPLTIASLLRELKAGGIDVIHTHDMRANLLAATSRPFRRAPWLCHVHGWLGPTHKGRHRVYEAMDRRLVRGADHVLVGSHAAKEEVRAEGVRSCSVAWNAVPLPDIPPRSDAAGQNAGQAFGQAAARKRLGLDPGKVVFTILGRLHAGKGQDLFLEALAALAGSPQWQGVIVGVGEMEGGLKALAARLGIAERVRFTGFVESTAPWIAASDVIVVPSRKESLPLTCLEGMAHGKAVIVSTAGDLARVVDDGRSGLVVPIGSARAITAAMARLLADEAERERFGAAARRHVEKHHSAERLAGEMIRAARDLLAPRERAVMD